MRRRRSRTILGHVLSLAALALAVSSAAHAFWDLPRLALSDGSLALYVAPPDAGTPGRRWPLVLPLHGMADRADWECHVWSETAGPGFGFFVCPHGELRKAVTVWRGKKYPAFPTASRWASDAQVKKRATEAVALLRAKFGADVADGGAICVGFSQGAYHALKLALHEPAICAAAIAVMPMYRAEWIPRPAAGARAAPLWIVTGTRDVGYGPLRAARERLITLGHAVELQTFEGLGHRWPADFATAVHPAFAWVTARL